MSSTFDEKKISFHVSVVIPCFRCGATIEAVVSAIPESVASIILVDDRSDDGQADVLAELSRKDMRTTIVTHEANRGVGAATVSGYRRAVELGAHVIVKLDSDGQMDPSFIPNFVEPITGGRADYVKGNRFFDIAKVRSMPITRLIGNAGLTFLSRFSSGYWNVADPTNGYTAVSAEVVKILPLEKVHQRYFFESDLLFRLNTFGAVVIDQPMEAVYRDEESNLSVINSLCTFPLLHMRNLAKRIAYNYFLRNFDVASLSLLAGLLLMAFGVVFGSLEWVESSRTGNPATAGTVMLSVTPLLIGFQLLLAFLHHDVTRTPTRIIHRRAGPLTVLSKRSRSSQIIED